MRDLNTKLDNIEQRVTRLELAIDRIRRAWLDKGSHPDYHDATKARLQREWPRLYIAIADLIDQEGTKP